MRIYIGLVAGLAALTAGCQTYDFEPVRPLAIAQKTDSEKVIGRVFKPTLMLTVDKSGSMLDPINPSDPACTPGCGSAGAACPNGCRTRISELRTAMGSFLTTYGTVARMGLTTYPKGGGSQQCTAPALADIMVQLPTVDDDSVLQNAANTIRTAIDGLTPLGGTPTGAALAGLTDYSLMKDTQRGNFILLLTDGLPNCNSGNPNSCAAPAACKCTTATGCNVPGNLCCLDQDGTVAAITQLRSQNIMTIVVGFGADLATGDAPTVLSAMALAGGQPRACKADADCGAGDTCNVAQKVCNKPYYQAANAQELGEALSKITEGLTPDACGQNLSQKPSDPRFLSVMVDGVEVASGPDTWTYDFNANRVNFLGALCTRLENSTPQSPVNIEYRIVQSL